MSRLQKLALATLLASLALVAVGGFTRGSGSGYGCSDRWPLCEGGGLGGFVPRWEFHMVVEWSHRWLAATVGVLAVVTLIEVLRFYRRQRRVLIPTAAAVVAIGLQAYLGRLVVKGGLDADLVSAHFVLSMIVVGLLAVTTANAGTVEADRTAGGRDRESRDVTVAAADGPTDRRWRAMCAAAAGGSLAVAVLGSLVHDRYLPGWPIVNFGAASDAGITPATIAVHSVHRVFAGAELVAVVLLWIASRRRGCPKSERVLVAIAAGCYVVGAAFGAGHVVAGARASGLVVAHLAIAESAWAALVAATALASRRPRVADPDDAGSATEGTTVPAAGTVTLADTVAEATGP